MNLCKAFLSGKNSLKVCIPCLFTGVCWRRERKGFKIFLFAVVCFGGTLMSKFDVLIRD